ncbi:NAD(P)/FAD-dependent oxidoreductase [Aquiflexum lacus]|uniref:NAD(P)/FAD-dependent oxidoreductase n=1 Tax=Aquiflexum lacus TaxID=2483805 RepID=UPI001895EE6F|nr:FAD-binding oxidoreductase [Aquiflexum lacus]
MDVDFLLIGQGLAGTVLSFRLLEFGAKVLVIDQPESNLSSRVAAGLYNPITGKKMVKTWNADLLFPEIEPLYQKMESFLSSKFLFPKNIYRPFLTIEEQNEWMGKSGESGFQNYFDQIHTKSLYPEVKNSYGGIMLKNSGYLNINMLLDEYSKYLKKEGLLVEGKFEEDLLQIKEEGVFYQGITAKAIVYCNGLGAMQSRFFRYLPFAPVKGEILDVKQAFYPDEIVNRGVFRISLPNGLHRVGSTYTKDDLDLGPTEKSKKEILDKLEKLLSIPLEEVIYHRYGIRPATRDRKPFIGKHTEFKSVYIFNGFGAKGVSLIPYYSKKMVEMLIYDRELEKDVNIQRWKNA